MGKVSRRDRPSSFTRFASLFFFYPALLLCFPLFARPANQQDFPLPFSLRQQVLPGIYFLFFFFFGVVFFSPHFFVCVFPAHFNVCPTRSLIEQTNGLTPLPFQLPRTSVLRTPHHDHFLTEIVVLAGRLSCFTFTCGVVLGFLRIFEELPYSYK